jgi:hypothetical protein
MKEKIELTFIEVGFGLCAVFAFSIIYSIPIYETTQPNEAFNIILYVFNVIVLLCLACMIAAAYAYHVNQEKKKL